MRGWAEPKIVGRNFTSRIRPVSVIDAILAVNVLPSLYFQMFHRTMYVDNDHHLCISFMHMPITVSDFIFLRTVVYHVDRRNNLRVSE